VDDEGNEIVVKVVEKDELNEKVQLSEEPPRKLSREEQIKMLDDMIKNIENLPQQALTLPVNHYDLYSFMLLVSSILKN
jgi:hypothetical protein